MERYQVLRLVYPEQVLSLAVLAGKDGAVLVDCGYPGSLRQLEEALRGCGVALEELAGLVLTHQDDDHMGAAAELKAVCPRLRIYASAEEAPYIEGVRKNLRLQQAEDLQERLPEEQRAWGEQFCRRLRALRCVPVDVLVHNGDRFDWGGGCEIIATPRTHAGTHLPSGAGQCVFDHRGCRCGGEWTAGGGQSRLLPQFGGGGAVFEAAGAVPVPAVSLLSRRYL